jgi:hypothetical protein
MFDTQACRNLIQQILKMRGSCVASSGNDVQYADHYAVYLHYTKTYNRLNALKGTDDHAPFKSRTLA